MCMKTHIRKASHPKEILIFFAVGTPLIMCLAWILSVPISDVFLVIKGLFV